MNNRFAHIFCIVAALTLIAGCLPEDPADYKLGITCPASDTLEIAIEFSCEGNNCGADLGAEDFSLHADILTQSGRHFLIKDGISCSKAGGRDYSCNISTDKRDKIDVEHDFVMLFVKYVPSDETFESPWLPLGQADVDETCSSDEIVVFGGNTNPHLFNPDLSSTTGDDDDDDDVIVGDDDDDDVIVGDDDDDDDGAIPIVSSAGDDDDDLPTPQADGGGCSLSSTATANPIALILFGLTLLPILRRRRSKDA